MKDLVQAGRALLEKAPNLALVKKFKALGGSVKSHKTDSSVIVLRLPKGSKAELQSFLQQHGIAQTQTAKTGGYYELAFIDKNDWPAKPSTKSAPKKAKAKGLPWRRETIHGAKVLFKSGVSAKKEKVTVAQLLHAREIMKRHRFADAFGGTIVIAPKAKGGVAGTYQWRTDTTTLYPRVSKTTIIHELGHRWWYQNMTRPRRLQFIAWVKAGLSPVSSYGGKDSWEAFAEAFKYFILGKKMTPQQVETFKLMARGGRFESVAYDGIAAWLEKESA